MSTNCLKILIVDDIEDNLFLLEDILDQPQYEVVKANSGQQALDILATDTDFALILMDVMMPGMDGFETVKCIKEIGNLQDISVVFITALAPSDLSMRQGYANGAIDFIVKPIDSEYLLAKVQAFCTFYQQKKAMQDEIKQRKSLMRQLQLSSTIFNTSSEGIIVTDERVMIQAVNPAFESITGYSSAEIIGKNPNTLQSGLQDDDFYKIMWFAIKKVGYWEGEVRNRRKNGEIYPEWLRISKVLNDDGKITNYIGTFSDISSHASAKQKLYYLAHYDALTELPNRVLFQETLKHEISNAQRNNTKLALFFLDLDRFKVINDTLGHSAGDKLLQEVSGRLLECMRDNDMLSRQGGDEFTGIILGLNKAEEAAIVAEKMIKVMEQPVLIQGEELYVTASIGISIYPDDTNSQETLLKYADSAMYRAKDKGRNTYTYYQEDTKKLSSKRFDMEAKLRKAMDNDEFELHYQPKYDTVHGHITGMEALIRWNQPELGRVGPFDFIPIAEETGLIVPIGEWVLNEACRQNKAWQDAGFPGMRVAVNLSSRQFNDGNMLEMVNNIISKHTLDFKYLELELTESMIMQDADATINILKALHGCGIQLSIDDFGTGYSSLSYLKKFPITKLKLDRSFIMGLPEDKDDAKIVAAMISLAHGLDLTVIAEGVETREQLAWLEQAGCNEIQGYFFNAPMSASDFTTLLKTTYQQPNTEKD
ncbi:MAG: EAL domain-containing protein [Ghiorsea sp.]